MNINVFRLEHSFPIKESRYSLTTTSLDEISRQLPQGVYSTFRTYGKKSRVLGLKAHLARLYIPAEASNIKPSASSIELRQALKNILSEYHAGEARVRISLSLTQQPGLVYILIEPLKLLGADVYAGGIKLVTTTVERTNPRLKATNFIEKSEGERMFLLKTGVTEALIVHKDKILEGLTSNFYAVKNQKIITAQKGILLGVTRRVVLRLARAQGLEIEYRSMSTDQFQSIDEAFITSSSRGVVPVVRINDQIVGQGMVGNIARMLKEKYDEYVLQKAEPI